MTLIQLKSRRAFFYARGECRGRAARIKRGARCADAGSKQRVPKNTPDTSPRNRLSEDYLIRRTVPPEGFLTREPFRPKAS